MAKAKRRAKRKGITKGKKKKGKVPKPAAKRKKPAAKAKKKVKPKKVAKPKRKVAPAKKVPAKAALAQTAKLKQEAQRWQELHGQLQEQIRAKDSTIAMQMQEIMELKRTLEQLTSPA
ncbi:MAG: hypothetical protein ACE5JQ_03610 [Candidatus Methylomirabilales bacterium]